MVPGLLQVDAICQPYSIRAKFAVNVSSHPMDSFSGDFKICYGMCSCICHTKIVMGYSLTLTYQNC